MPRFLSKLFRRKGDKVDDKKPKKQRNSGRKRFSGSPKASPTKKGSPSKNGGEPLQPRKENNHESHLNRTPTATTASDRGSTSTNSRPQQQNNMASSPRVAQENTKKSAAQQQQRRTSNGPVDLDDTDMEESDVENRSTSPRLSFHQLQQFDRHSSSQNAAHHLYVHSPMDNSLENGSNASSSDFNLSTDAEDTEYNNLRRRGGAPYLNTSQLDTSNISQMSSPTAYTTDDEHAIFAALQTDDEVSTREEPPLATNDAPDDEAQGLNIVPMAHETEDDMRAWTVSPTASKTSMKSGSDSLPKGTTSPKAQAFASSSSANGNSNAYNKNNKTKTAPTPKVVKVEQAPPKSSVAEDAFGKDAFENFAKFDDVFPMEQAKPRTFLVEAPERRIKTSSSASAAPPQETSLSDLLAQAKRKSSRSKRGNSSVNSAPVITSSYLRETHKLGGHHHHSRSSDSRSVDKTTSVSDIIESLEATNASRIKTSSSRSSRHRHSDAHSQGGTSTRSAKERLREKRRQERNRTIGSDESDEDNAEAESWLFDEVTGALGPRGVAADMESLGGRSKSSAGNKSHRSHRSHRSHKSHRSSRRKKSSSESVDSRNSRSSRYSHRSTRSYLSQMSEQSRSVANDLLRLEMQLAMVGSQEVAEEKGSGSVTGSTTSRTSRVSRTSHNNRGSRSSSSVSKRSKMTVVAPPGKLGIILANKADSKGTVVSGVRTSSVLAEKISPGDRIIAIDGEDVSLMTVSEITTIMARKSDFERQLTIMTTPKHLGLTSQSRGDYHSSEGGDYYRR